MDKSTKSEIVPTSDDSLDLGLMDLIPSLTSSQGENFQSQDFRDIFILTPTNPNDSANNPPGKSDDDDGDETDISTAETILSSGRSSSCESISLLANCYEEVNSPQNQNDGSEKRDFPKPVVEDVGTDEEDMPLALISKNLGLFPLDDENEPLIIIDEKIQNSNESNDSDEPPILDLVEEIENIENKSETNDSECSDGPIPVLINESPTKTHDAIDEPLILENFNINDDDDDEPVIIFNAKKEKTKILISENVSATNILNPNQRRRRTSVSYEEIYSASDDDSDFISPSTPAASSAKIGPENLKKKESKKKRGRKKGSRGKKGAKKTGQSSTQGAAKIDEEEEEEVVKEICGMDTILRPSGKTLDWDFFLKKGQNMLALPHVFSFKHAPFSKVWHKIALVNLLMEVPNPFIRSAHEVYWVAKPVYFAGYFALIEFETFNTPGIPKHHAWLTYISEIPKQTGYCIENNIALFPPFGVEEKNPNFLLKIKKLYSEKPSLPKFHGPYVKLSLDEIMDTFPLGTLMEVRDLNYACRNRIGKVSTIIGDRIFVAYALDSPTFPNRIRGFWSSIHSVFLGSIFPLGWSKTVGYPLYTGDELSDEDKEKLNVEVPIEKFPPLDPSIILEKGQMVEARHPTRPYLICSATIIEVYKNGYVDLEFKINRKERRSPVWFSFHISSPYILPCGFSQKNGIKIIYPSGEELDTFNWDDYFTKSGSSPAPVHLLPPRPPNTFLCGFKFEATGILDSSYLGPCTVLKKAAHLLYIKFDGWPTPPLGETDTEFWCDFESPDIFPIGYAEMVGHEFQGRVEMTDLKQFPDLFK